MQRRRFTDRIREAADAAWDRGYKDLATELHAMAREAEAMRCFSCSCATDAAQPMFHESQCPYRRKFVS